MVTLHHIDFVLSFGSQLVAQKRQTQSSGCKGCQGCEIWLNHKEDGKEDTNKSHLSQAQDIEEG